MVTAKALCEKEGLTYINGYNDAAIIAGQGTTALEILEQVSAKSTWAMLASFASFPAVDSFAVFIFAHALLLALLSLS